MPTCCVLSRVNPYWINTRSQERARSRRLNHLTSWCGAMSQSENKWTNCEKNEQRLQTRRQQRVREVGSESSKIRDSNRLNRSKSCARQSMNGKRKQKRSVSSGFSGRSDWSF